MLQLPRDGQYCFQKSERNLSFEEMHKNIAFNMINFTSKFPLPFYTFLFLEFTISTTFNSL